MAELIPTIEDWIARRKRMLLRSGVAILLLATVSVKAQSVPQIPDSFSFQGQTFTRTTNATGQLIYSESGPMGAVSQAVPTMPAQTIAEIKAIINANNPSNANFYTPGEIEARVGGGYEQNSGQAFAVLSVTKWSVIPATPNIGIEGALLQGNQSGQSGTAGGYGAINYRRIIGDVAAEGGMIAGYDNYNKKLFFGVKGGVEYRENQHIGQFVDVNFALEKQGNQTRGFGFAAGVIYAF